jgi:hypothetical protein
VKRLPEVLPFVKTFSAQSLPDWYFEMEIHNRTVRRGFLGQKHLRIGQKLLRKFMLYSSLDAYMLQIRAAEITQALDALILFAERLVPIIRDDKDAMQWWFDARLLIQRRHWFRLARQAQMLANLVRLSCAVDLEQEAGQDLGSKAGAWPGWDHLQNSAQRVYQIFSTFCR